MSNKLVPIFWDSENSIHYAGVVGEDIINKSYINMYALVSNLPNNILGIDPEGKLHVLACKTTSPKYTTTFYNNVDGSWTGGGTGTWGGFSPSDLPDGGNGGGGSTSCTAGLTGRIIYEFSDVWKEGSGMYPAERVSENPKKFIADHGSGDNLLINKAGNGEIPMTYIWSYDRMPYSINLSRMRRAHCFVGELESDLPHSKWEVRMPLKLNEGAEEGSQDINDYAMPTEFPEFIKRMNEGGCPVCFHLEQAGSLEELLEGQTEADAIKNGVIALYTATQQGQTAPTWDDEAEGLILPDVPYKPMYTDPDEGWVSGW